MGTVDHQKMAWKHRAISCDSGICIQLVLASLLFVPVLYIDFTEMAHAIAEKIADDYYCWRFFVLTLHTNKHMHDCSRSNFTQIIMQVSCD